MHQALSMLHSHKWQWYPSHHSYCLRRRGCKWWIPRWHLCSCPGHTHYSRCRVRFPQHPSIAQSSMRCKCSTPRRHPCTIQQSSRCTQLPRALSRCPLDTCLSGLFHHTFYPLSMARTCRIPAAHSCSFQPHSSCTAMRPQSSMPLARMPSQHRCRRTNCPLHTSGMWSSLPGTRYSFPAHRGCTGPHRRPVQLHTYPAHTLRTTWTLWDPRCSSLARTTGTHPPPRCQW